ncbi:MAG: DEAD/DEAH box helicase [Patescibacteria group bacterium]
MMEKSLFIKVGRNHTPNKLASELIVLGYDRSDGQTLKPGQFFNIGDLFKLYNINDGLPLKIDFFGDEIERMSYYDQVTGKKVSDTNSIEILPNILLLPDKTIIHVDDYVVHDDHGIGLFAGFENKNVDGEIIKYVLIKYLKDDLLYLPINQLIKLTPYIGIGRRKPKLNRLGSGSWTRTYKKTYEDIIKMARELLLIYAEREVTRRPSYKINPEWNAVLESNFGFDETIDQVKAIEEVMNDLSSEKPMDRLICGDVGFGKTEVAIRAAAQVIANGGQVALLVPTTILAEQHFTTLSKRFAALPVRIERVSRFIDGQSQNTILKDLIDGRVDLLIGTHRLLSEKIVFRNLKLVIIDEEQKFGVKHKEKLKDINKEVDALTLTATPIPRTLFMSLSGIRDISMIASSPAGRKSVDTEVSKFDESKIKKYIDRELSRGGQIYYLHNEVSTINGKKRKLDRLLPGLRIEVAHGQMGEMALAKTMSAFARGDIDVLVCSTIVENGLDLPNVNTLIVENADKFGLSQLYQIRGRIGRSKKQSYALFTFPQKEITANAVKRLKVLVENTELGTGYNIALRDLEIRGGGNILGRDQHGSMEAVGLVLYSKLLKMAVEKIKEV